MSNRVRSILITLLILISGFAIMKVLKAQKEVPARKTEMAKKADYKLQKVQPGPVKTEVQIAGQAAAYNKIQIYAEVSGVLAEAGQPFRTGHRFSKDEVLFRIDDSVYRNNVLAQKSSLLNHLTLFIPDLAVDYPESAEKWNHYLDNFDFDAKMADLPKTESAQEKFYIASHNIYNLYYSIKSMEATLAKYTIRAPFSGVVTEASVTPGTLVRAGQMVGEFTGTGLYEIEAPASIRDLAYLKPGMPVTLTCSDIDGPFKGFIKRINQKIDRSSQTVKVYLHTKEQRLKDGMYVQAHVNAATIADAVRIPTRWLQEGQQVYVYQNNSFKLQKVDVVRNENDFVILRGLTAGTEILAGENIPM